MSSEQIRDLASEHTRKGSDAYLVLHTYTNTCDGLTEERDVLGRLRDAVSDDEAEDGEGEERGDAERRSLPAAVRGQQQTQRRQERQQEARRLQQRSKRKTCMKL